MDTCSQDSTFFQIHASDDLNPSSFKLQEINKNKLVSQRIFPLQGASEPIEPQQEAQKPVSSWGMLAKLKKQL